MKERQAVDVLLGDKGLFPTCYVFRWFRSCAVLHSVHLVQFSLVLVSSTYMVLPDTSKMLIL